MKVQHVLVAYAVVLVVTGVIAYMMAPEGARAGTALIVPSICALLALIFAALAAMVWRAPIAGIIGIYGGLVLPLLLAGAFAMRASAADAKLQNYPAARAEYEQALAADPALAQTEARRAFFQARQAPDHNVAYLRNTLWFLTVVSVLTFLALAWIVFFGRPRAAHRPAEPPTAALHAGQERPPPDAGGGA